MSNYGGCICCGVSLGKDEILRCSDCVQDKYMVQTGTKAIYIKLEDSGPIDVTKQVLEWEEKAWKYDDLRD